MAKKRDLWSLIWGTPQVDPTDLASAVAAQAQVSPLDFRTRLLVRDSVDALRGYWGTTRLDEWLQRCPARERIEMICGENLGEPGFATIRERLMEKTDPEVVRQLFRELGKRVRGPLRLSVGGSIALILPGYLSRATADIDIVDELPEELRSQHNLLDDIRKRYGLMLTHFQSHYLPTGWQNRLQFLDSFDQVQVYLVDVHDVFLSKLFSNRDKDLDDMRQLAPQLDKTALMQRLRDTTASLRAEEALRRRAENNWHILFGEALPG